MTIQIGDRLPEVVLKRIRNGVESVDTPTLFNGRKVVLFAVPGAFTPTCSEKHLPGFIERFEDFRRRGIDVVCVAVNDPFVMQAWGKSLDAPEGLQLVSDGNADLTRALGRGDGRQRLRHGHPRAPVRAVCGGWRGQAALRRSAGRVQSVVGGACAGAAWLRTVAVAAAIDFRC